MLSFFNRFRRAEPTTAVETNAPKPKERDAFVEPIGYPTQINPLDPKSRKDPAALVAAAQQVSQEKSRAARYRDFDLMDTGDFAALLDVVVDAALTFESDDELDIHFKVAAKKRSDQKLFDDSIKQADLHQLIEEVARDMLKYGDAFVEPIFNKKLLTDVQTYDPKEMFVTRDDKGRLAQGVDDDKFPVAFQQKRQGRVIAGWYPWEMIHGKLRPSRKLLYSRAGLLDPLRADWRNLKLVEQGMVVARLTRAYQKRVHYIDVTGKDRSSQEDTLREYIRRVTKSQYGRKPTNADGMPIVDASDDLFITVGYIPGSDGKSVPTLNKTEVESPALAGLAELGDVNYLRQKGFVQVPSDAIGINRNMAGDLDSQDIAYQRFIRKLQRQLNKVLRGIFDQVLLANGKLPGTVDYTIIFPSLDIQTSWRYADARFRASMELRNYVEMASMPRREVLKRAFNLTDAQVDEWMEQARKEKEDPLFAPVVPQQQPNGQNNQDDPNKKDTSQGAAKTNQAAKSNGVDTGTPLSMRNRGSMSGG